MKIQIARAIQIAAVAGTLVSAAVGCKKETVPSKDKLNPSDIPTLLSAGDGQNDLLGYGYDVTGEYANSSASKFSVIDVNALKAAQPLRVEWDLSKTQVGILNSGENARSYLYKKSQKVNASVDVPLFKASITGAFNSSDAFNSKYIYSDFDLVIKQKRVKLNADISLLKTYLQPTFLADVQSRTPAQIVATYGTHVLTDIILGAKLQVMYQSQSTASERSRSSEIGIDVGLKKLFNINAGLNFSYSEEEKNANFSQRLYYRTIGGDPSKSILGQVPIGSNTPTIDISSWQSSSNEANAELIDFGENGLLPLWELIDDPVKQTNLKDYIIQYLNDRSASLVAQKIYAKIYADNIDNHFYYDSYWSDVKTGDQYIQFFDEDGQTPAVFRGNISYRYNIVHEDGTDIWRYGTIYSAWVENKHKFFLSRAFISSKGNKKHPWAEMMFEIMPGTGYEPINIQLDPRP